MHARCKTTAHLRRKGISGQRRKSHSYAPVHDGCGLINNAQCARTSYVYAYVYGRVLLALGSWISYKACTSLRLDYNMDLQAGYLFSYLPGHKSNFWTLWLLVLAFEVNITCHNWEQSQIRQQNLIPIEALTCTWNSQKDQIELNTQTHTHTGRLLYALAAHACAKAY